MLCKRFSAFLLSLLLLCGTASADAPRDYAYAQELLAQSRYQEAAACFDALGGYEDASRLSVYCLTHIAAQNGEFGVAAASFESLGDYKDCLLLSKYYSARQAEKELTESFGTYESLLEKPKRICTATEAIMARYGEIPLFRDSRARIPELEKNFVRFPQGVSRFSHGYAVFYYPTEDDGRAFGLVSAQGEVLLRNVWKSMDTNGFCEGLLCVADKDGWCGYIDTQLNVAIPCRWEAAQYFSEGLAAVKSNGKWGYINTQGERVVKYQWDEALAFSGGYACVKKGGKWGMIDQSGNVIVEPRYDSTFSFSQDGLARVRLYNKYGLIDKTGAVVIDCLYDNFFFSVSEGVTWIEQNDLYGVIDLKGNVIVPPQYDNHGTFAGGLSTMKKGEKYGLISKTGYVVLEPQYESITAVQNEQAWARQNGLWGKIDLHGNVLVDFQFESLFAQDDVFWAQKDGLYGVIDSDGRTLMPFAYEDLDFPLKGDLMMAQKDGKWGVVGKKGVAVPFVWDDLTYFSTEYLLAEKDGLAGIIDIRGRVLYAPQWDMSTLHWNYIHENRLWIANRSTGQFFLLDMQGNILI